MSAWKVRHEGSPRSIDGLSLPQVLEGLQDGRWEATDEVMGPEDGDWVAIENHPQLAEVAADLEPPPPRVYDDETRLDMNALIDVCLVLLIFFILTTSYSLLQKRLDAPKAASNSPDRPAIREITPEEIKDKMIYVVVRMENGKPVTSIEEKVVDPNRLEYDLTNLVKQTGKTHLVLKPDPDVPHKAVVAVLDAARGARMEGVSLVVREEEKK
jgi:biopolymer transport protein ExbD